MLPSLNSDAKDKHPTFIFSVIQSRLLPPFTSDAKDKHPTFNLPSYGAECYRHSIPTVKANTQHLFQHQKESYGFHTSYRFLYLSAHFSVEFVILETLVDASLSADLLGAESLPVPPTGEVEGPVLVVVVGRQLSNPQDLQLAIFGQRLDLPLQTVNGASLGVGRSLLQSKWISSRLLWITHTQFVP